MKPLKEKISITLDSDLVAQLKSEAETDDRSLSLYINLLPELIRKTEEHMKTHRLLNGGFCVYIRFYLANRP